MDSRIVSVDDWRRMLAPTLEGPANSARPGRFAQAVLSPRLTYGRHFGPVLPSTRPAAVLVLICRINGQWHVPFTIRPAHLRDHAGQVSLPGGRQESGESSQQTALRELSEELNCDTNAIEMVGQLSDVYVYNSNFLVTPWVAVTGAALEFAPNPDEVADWFSLPLGEITSAPQITSKQIRRGPFHFSAPCFHWREYQIWGATSMILSELQCLLRNTLGNRLGDR